MNDRLKQVRKHFNYNQAEFGKKIGLTKAAISRLESGINNLTEQTIKSICREFNVDYIWLTTGNGEMFGDNSEELQLLSNIDKILADEDDIRKNLLKWTINLSDNEIDVFCKMIDSLYKAIKKD